MKFDVCSLCGNTAAVNPGDVDEGLGFAHLSCVANASAGARLAEIHAVDWRHKGLFQTININDFPRILGHVGPRDRRPGQHEHWWLDGDGNKRVFSND